MNILNLKTNKSIKLLFLILLFTSTYGHESMCSTKPHEKRIWTSDTIPFISHCISISVRFSLFVIRKSLSIFSIGKPSHRKWKDRIPIKLKDRLFIMISRLNCLIKMSLWVHRMKTVIIVLKSMFDLTISFFFKVKVLFIEEINNVIQWQTQVNDRNY